MCEHFLHVVLKLGQELLQVVGFSRERRQGHLSNLGHDLHPLLDVAKHDCIVEARHRVLTHLCNLEHLLQLLQVAGDEVQEGQGVKVLRLLIDHLNDLLVALSQRLQAQSSPARVVVQLLGSSHGLFDVTILQCQVESGLLILDEVQRHLRIPLLLQVANHHIATYAAVCDPHLDIVELPLVKCQLEEVFCAVQPLLVNLLLSVHVVELLLVHPHDVDGVLQGVDDATVTIGQAVLHMAQRCIHEHAILVPCT
mmetsp:Transcript_39917/g.93995  ORF Transcript_39917/g.93995 Transcript_39917/m.93995 type:complete len:253 (+) Transcript_39917:1433-2191(+)